MTLLHAGLDKLNTISCANCTGFSSAAVRAIGSMHGLVELNLRGYMPLGSLQSLTALQALTGTLQRVYSVTTHANRVIGSVSTRTWHHLLPDELKSEYFGWLP